MANDGQMERMHAVYAEKSDRELETLFGQRDDLMPAAQAALERMMQERGLSPQERALGDAAVSTAAMRAAADEDALGTGEVLVYLFTDAFEAREAMRHMEAAGIEHRMLDWHLVEPKMQVSYTGVDLGLVTAQADAVRARTVLKEKLGLFPGVEVDAQPADAEEEMVVLSMLERDQALVAAHALGVAGIGYLWRDGRDASAGLPDAETVALEVAAAAFERASAIVEEALFP